MLEIHIPEGEHLTEGACLDAIQSAREFFARYFPDFSYAAFTCHSWLLDDRLKEYLSEESGILRFAALFDKVAADESTALLRYLFTWDTTRLNLRHRYPTSSLAAKVQRAVCRGERFYEVLGVIPK